ncbi:uncharacterized protein LOC119833053 [Zerene cesonia]|uniref:uncharacterized protein LOC119833053 n=1 Tax=Zerene cesonia TaxID=33412 RepID=UPI0018E50716|nr:uncharacterized protein LOC119833053 [Zerene cesonia]
MLSVLLLLLACKIISSEVTTEVQLLNELSIEKLLQLKNSFKDMTTEYYNTTVTTPSYMETFGAQAMAMRAPPIKRADYEDGLHKKEGNSKLSNIFSMTVTTLAFLAFGGYLLCLIVHAMRAKHTTTAVVTPQPTIFVNAGIKRPQTQFASYGRRKRQVDDITGVVLPPEEMFSALLQVCEGYAKWNEYHN